MYSVRAAPPFEASFGRGLLSLGLIQSPGKPLERLPWASVPREAAGAAEEDLALEGRQPCRNRPVGGKRCCAEAGELIINIVT